MNKIILALALLVTSTTVFSQVTFKPGVRAGLNIASISNTDENGRIGISAGIFGELKLGELYALQPEIIYNQQGTENVELDYLSIRVTSKFYFLKDNFPVYALVSPGFDIELGGNVETYSNATGAGVNLESDISFAGGFGYDFPFGLGVEARFKKGIVGLGDNFPRYNQYGNSYATQSGISNTVIQIAAIYKFDFSR
ncbi:porin family protein [Lacinutrix sp. C3R15]|uniref:outer membrane beta-barrel protein n=1 Tax=Flavobacteriaceae TaxID=49546 RepID=UPI001C08F0E6|nr:MULTISPECIES: outer membrane beta-barrel protein [Flavobacteriaceae]MBU2938196.1 porin family protein [Lacinutrix sp. C3R15]MDO6621510.1 outer membrane beta-barrel protein [Oceanihabitans sp. 1_MG-2023]